MYFTAAIALTVLAFTDRVFGVPYNTKPTDCSSTQTVKATPTPDAYPEPPMKGAQTARAVYFITNTDPNSVVCMPIGHNGLLSKIVLTPTGGKGLGGIGANGSPAMPDSLFSQGALTVVDDLLFAVNAGSNTVSMLKISDENPCKLSLVGTPQSTSGEFPVSVTYSSVLKTACVANGGAIDGVSCYSVSRETGLKILDYKPRPLGLGQKTPAMGPLNTIGQVRFAEDSKSLYVTVKGNPSMNNTGFIAVYPVEYGAVSRTPVKSSPPGTAVLFGIGLISANKIIVAEPLIGAAILDIDPKFHIATADPLVHVNNQTAICWALFDSKTGTAFLTDGGQNHVVEVDVNTGAVITDLHSTNGNRAMFDEAVGADFLYALSPTVNKTMIAVFDLSGGRGTIKEVQNFEVAGLTSPGTSMGLAVSS